MKLTLFSLLYLLLFVPFSFARDEGGQGVGNGGGGWGCYEKDRKTLRWVRTRDLFEAENEWNFKITSSTKKYKTQISNLLNELQPVMPAFVKSVRENIKIVKKIKKEMTSTLPLIDDAMEAVWPAESMCKDGVILPVQIAVCYGSTKVDLNTTLFNHATFSESERAALYLHEAVYLLLRGDKGKDVNSVRTRMIVSLIFAKMPASEKAGRIQFLLDHPEYQNHDVNHSRGGSYVPKFSEEDLAFFESFSEKLYARLFQEEKEIPSFKNDPAILPVIEKYAPLLFEMFKDRVDYTVAQYDESLRSIFHLAGAVSFSRLRAFIDSLPSTSPAEQADKVYHCIRYRLMGVDATPPWLGVALRPLWLSKMDPNPLGDPKLWLQRIILNHTREYFGDYELSKSGMLIQDAHAPATDRRYAVKTFSSTELLGWILTKDAKNPDFFDSDFTPILLYCRALP